MMMAEEEEDFVVLEGCDDYYNEEVGAAEEIQATADTSQSMSTSTSILNNGDYYDDDDHGDGDGGHDDKMYTDACSLSRFMINPCMCMIKTVLSSTTCRRCTSNLCHYATANDDGRRHLRRREESKNEKKINLTTRGRSNVSPMISSSIAVMSFVFAVFICIQIRLHVMISSPPSSSTMSLPTSISSIEESLERWINTPRRTRGRKQNNNNNQYDHYDIDDDELYGFQILVSTFGSRIRSEQGSTRYDVGGWIFRRHFFVPDDPLDRFQFDFFDKDKNHSDIFAVKPSKQDEQDTEDTEGTKVIAEHPQQKITLINADYDMDKGKDTEEVTVSKNNVETQLPRDDVLTSLREMAQPDYGGIEFQTLATDTSTSLLLRRVIDQHAFDDINDRALTDEEKKEIDDRIHGLDEETWTAENLSLEYDEDIEDFDQECRRPAFKNEYHPTCNAVHELDLARDYIPTSNGQQRIEDGHGIDFDSGEYIDDQDYDTFYINHGYFRDVWVVHQPNVDTKTILKILRWTHRVGMSMAQEVLMDAVIMERMTASPRIVDIYHHCGTAVWVEAINYEVEKVIVPGDGYYDLKINNETMTTEERQEIRNEFPMVEDIMSSTGEMIMVPKPFNDFTAVEKLDIALQMAKSLADMHGYFGGVIVHDDVQLCQWLRTKDGKIKLGDFNRAQIMDYNPTKQQYCKYNNGHGNGNYRAPEEFEAKDLNEQIDVFSFGNNIYGLLTGLWVFYDDQDYDSVQARLIRGERAYVDPRWRLRSKIESRLIDIMIQCWESDPDNKRITIFEAVRQLQQLWDETQR